MQNSINGWKNKLKAALEKELPGAVAHRKVAPEDRIKEIIGKKWPSDAKRSAVTFLLFPINGEIHTIFMKRPQYPGVHSGQVSLPGGQRDEEDAGLMQTAQREYLEEAGVKLVDADFLGSLSEFYIPPSNFLVQPFVAFIDKLPQLTPQKEEVESFHIIGLKELFDPQNFSSEEIHIRNRKGGDYKIQAPCYKVDELIIWGATAMMISELEWILNKNTLKQLSI